MAVEAGRVMPDELHSFVEAVLTQVGMPTPSAQTAAAAMVMPDSWGVFTHGTKLLRDNLRRLRGGGLQAAAQPRMAAEGPAWGIVEGNACMGQVASTFAVRAAIEKARQTGMAYVGLRNTCNIGAAGYYAYLAAREGLIGITMANDTPSVAAPGSSRAVLGSNPLAYGVPTGDDQPIILDVATSTVAGGKVYAACQRGEPIPGDWIIDSQGRPTTDGRLYPESAALAPMAGHKGYGIALLIEILSGVMTGAAVTSQVGSWIWGDPTQPTHHGAAFLVLDVATVTDRDTYFARMRRLVDEIHQAPTASGVERVLLPGEREWNHRRRALVEGIPLPADVLGRLSDVASTLDMMPPWLARAVETLQGSG